MSPIFLSKKKKEKRKTGFRFLIPKNLLRFNIYSWQHFVKISRHEQLDLTEKYAKIDLALEFVSSKKSTWVNLKLTIFKANKIPYW